VRLQRDLKRALRGAVPRRKANPAIHADGLPEGTATPPYAGPIEDGVIFAAWTLVGRPPDAVVEVTPNLVLGIAFAKGWPANGSDVTKSLELLCDHIETLVFPALEPFLSANGGLSRSQRSLGRRAASAARSQPRASCARRLACTPSEGTWDRASHPPRRRPAPRAASGVPVFRVGLYQGQILGAALFGAVIE
jgi:hypothetical protein